MFTPQVIDIITNVVGLLIALFGAYKGLNLGTDVPIDWVTLILAELSAVIAYFTGKSVSKNQIPK